jgi:hypothetical protein
LSILPLNLPYIFLFEMIVAVILPVISFLCLYSLVYFYCNEREILTRIRAAIVRASLLVAAFIVITTEALSFNQNITFANIARAWILFDVFLAIVCLRKRRFIPIKEGAQHIAYRLKQNPLLLVIALLLIISGCLAILYPVNNHDSLSYHMARVEHWINNKSVSHFQTHILRQLIYPPFAEWSILHIQILTATDRFANALQTFFFALCIIEVSMITSIFGGNRKHQMLAAIVAATIPMAVIQSNTTQNDIVAAAFVLAFVYYTTKIVKEYILRNTYLFADIAFAGLSLGLALLTKGTAYLFSIWFCAWYALVIVKYYREPLGKILLRIVKLSPIVLIALLLNYGHYYRNEFLTGSVLGNGSKDLTNEAHDIKSIGFVALKNLMTHMPVTKEFKNTVSEFALSRGVDINDPKYSHNTISWMMAGLSFHEDYAQNFLHTLLILLVLAYFFNRKRLYAAPIALYTVYVITFVVIGLSFCYLLKWQPWTNRLQTTIFMVSAPIIGLTIGNFGRVPRAVVIITLVVYAYWALLWSEKHPVFPIRESIIKKPYDSFLYSGGMAECKQYLDTCSLSSIGLVVGKDSPDYLYYKSLAESDNGRRPMKHMLVNNISKMYIDEFLPDAIISFETRRDKYVIRTRTYVKEKTFTGGPSVFVYRY